MKLSRSYLFGVASGLVLSALIAMLFPSAPTQSRSAAGDLPAPAFAPSSPETASSAGSSTGPAPSAAAPAASESLPSGKTEAGNPAQASKRVVIPPGASAEKIAQLLQDEGWIQNKTDFLAIVKAKKLGNRFIAGTYEWVPGLSTEGIIDQLIH